MATTRIMSMHINKGKTIAQCLKARLDYVKNPDKTEQGKLISAYACAPETADQEFLLNRNAYIAKTGRRIRNEVIAYQVRQSFQPGEVTPEEANKIGYELASRLLNGDFAFLVATHDDHAHIHNHIYYNSTSLDCTRKFRDFIGSGRAVRRLSDRICLENDLSGITNPKLHSKGRFLHYGAWLGTERQPPYKEQLRLAINVALAKRPADFDAFLRLMEASGFTVKHGRGGTISFLVPGQERATRLRASTLGDGYDPEDIKAIIASLHEFNPMMGHRGCRLAVTYPEIAEMQTRAVLQAAIDVTRECGYNIVPEIMIPLVGSKKELAFVKSIVDETAKKVFEEQGMTLEYHVGTMIEIPRAAVTADEIAEEAEFFSFGTNDLTQMTFGFSRDDAGKFLGAYYDNKIFESDPFARLDTDGVGKLVQMAAKLGRQTRPNLKLGICGEHGGDPSSVMFCHKVGLNYVSCSPFRVPIARLAAAHAAILEKMGK